MDAFAIYRLPHASHCTLVGQSGVPATFPELKMLDGEERGFVISPFTPDDQSPIIVLRPDVMRQCTCDEVDKMMYLPYHTMRGETPLKPASRETYHEDFSRFHRAFSATGIQKLVLARSADIKHDGMVPGHLFSQACTCYPEAFVAMFSAPQCGTWLIATPELLLGRDGDRWQTMALAGTMPYSEQLPSWSDKNVQEQAYVARYIKDCLDRYSDDVSLTGPYTTRAGKLVHLRTDFNFSLSDNATVGHVLDALHPTPAVCGLPRQEAHRFILDHESCERSYYSGFSGPLNIQGDTAMFVSLRCMRILDDRFRLYAGGGILPQSEESMEWDETAAKMQAMLSLIDDCTES